MQLFPYLDQWEVLQQEYFKLPILPSIHLRWVVKTKRPIFEGCIYEVGPYLWPPMVLRCFLSLQYNYVHFMCTLRVFLCVTLSFIHYNLSKHSKV